MTKQIFGSVLAKKLFPDFREPKDKDFLVDEGVKTIITNKDI